MSDEPIIPVGRSLESRSEREMNAEGHLSTRQVSILTGIPVPQIKAEFDRQRGNTPDGTTFNFRMPRAWIESGLKRRQLAATDDMGEALVILEALDQLGALPETP